MYFLRSARLGFRTWRDSDRDLARGLWGDPRVSSLIDARGTLSEEDVARRLADEVALMVDHGIQYWPIFLLTTGEHVGCCGLRPRDPAARIYELGFHLRANHWGAGLASEAARAVIGYAFDVLGASALFAGHNPQNTASRHVLEKLGFVHTHDEHYPPTGLEHPSYRLTSPEEAPRPAPRSERGPPRS
jgi:RimJ/RimL family protein N-acetyltransferase